MANISYTITARMKQLRRRLSSGGFALRRGSAYQRPNTCLGGLCGLESLEARVMLTTVPNDPMFGDQWSLENTGQSGTIDTDIDAPTAWDTTTGSWDAVVAVSDGSINMAHPDLYLNIWLNQGEIPAAKMSALTDVDSDGLITFFDLNDPANAAHVSDVDHYTTIDYAGTWADSETTYGGLPPQLDVNGGTILSPIEDTWVRELQPTATWDGAGISAANFDVDASERRWGLIEFDVSGQSLTSLDLNLY